MHRIQNSWPLLLLLALPSSALPQSDSTPDRAEAVTRNDLLNYFQAENKRGTYIFYTQTYTSNRQHVEFHGSIFGVIQEVQAKQCELTIKSEIIDQYSGNIGHKLVGKTQSKYVTSIDFKLTPKIAEELKIVDARPVRQLPRGTNALCDGEQHCSLTWLKLTTEAPAIQMTDSTDDVSDYAGEVKDFSGPVREAFLPVSSTDAGNELIAKMRAYAQTCDQ